MLILLFLPLTVLAESVTVVLKRQGKLLGEVHQNPINGKSFQEFLGIPYANPPIGDLRLRSPTPAEAWEGEKKLEKKPACISNDDSNSNVSEDCLYLNVWVPGGTVDDSKLLPVVFLILDSSKYLYEGYQLATEQNLIVVTFEYRKGFLGFAAFGDEVPGNQGFMDQIMALQWVNVNIRSFGGDPSRIAVIGYKDAALFASLHLTCKRSRGLFESAIVLSGTSLADEALESETVMKHKTEEIFSALGCESAQVQNCLRDKSAEDILETVQKLGGLNFGPFFDSRLFNDFPESEMKARRINTRKVMIGASIDHLESEMWSMIEQNHPARKYELPILKSDKEFASASKAIRPKKYDNELAQMIIQHEYARWFEGSPEKRKAALLNMYSDRRLVCPMVTETNYNTKQGNDVYQYFFSKVSEDGELPYFLGLTKGDPNYTEIDKELGGRMNQYLGNFVRTGNPNFGPDGVRMSPIWPEYGIPGRKFMRFGSDLEVSANLRKPFCHFWNHYLPAILAYADKEVLDSDLFSMTVEFEEDLKPSHSDQEKKPSGCPYKH